MKSGQEAGSLDYAIIVMIFDLAKDARFASRMPKVVEVEERYLSKVTCIDLKLLDLISNKGVCFDVR